MRIVVLLAFVLLCGCAPQTYRQPPVVAASPVGVAAVRCMSKGYEKGSFEYDDCYRTSPEVEAFERNARLEKMNIIARNRSPYCAPGRSRPVI